MRRRALELRAAKDGNGAPPDGITPLSAMEENILSIIGEGAVDNVVIKSDPLADEVSSNGVLRIAPVSFNILDLITMQLVLSGPAKKFVECIKLAEI